MYVYIYIYIERERDRYRYRYRGRRCLFKVSMNIHIKLVRLVNLRVILSLHGKEFKSCRNKSFEKFL